MLSCVLRTVLGVGLVVAIVLARRLVLAIVLGIARDVALVLKLRLLMVLHVDMFISYTR